MSFTSIYGGTSELVWLKFTVAIADPHIHIKDPGFEEIGSLFNVHFLKPRSNSVDSSSVTLYKTIFTKIRFN